MVAALLTSATACPNCWSMHESSPQWKMQVLNMTTCTLWKHFACLLLELCPHALESIFLVQCMGLNIGAVLWACLKVQQSKQFHMIDRNVGVLSCIYSTGYSVIMLHRARDWWGIQIDLRSTVLCCYGTHNTFKSNGTSLRHPSMSLTRLAQCLQLLHNSVTDRSSMASQLLLLTVPLAMFASWQGTKH